MAVHSSRGGSKVGPADFLTACNVIAIAVRLWPISSCNSRAR